MQDTVLIIDDEKKLCGLLARIIGLEGFKVFQAYTGREGLKQVDNEDIDVVLSDVKLPDINGVELVTLIKRKKPYIEIINLTAFGTIADGVQAMKNGAFDYLTKGDDNDKIIPLLHKALAQSRRNRKIAEITNKINKPVGFDAIFGQSKLIQQAIEMARKVSIRETTVLLLGETGTGKEVFARAIHEESLRSAKAFVAINCSAFSPSLLESELFGYKKGAFTGAETDKKGLLEEADGGTVFLDEIGEMPPEMQAKILRVIENQTFIKVGDIQTTKVNVRIIAATNRDLEKEAETGKFRTDLYYRLSVFTIRLPELSSRKGDIKLLAKYFIEDFSAKMKVQFEIEPSFFEMLENYSWKGNIRELKNVIERAIILSEDNRITLELLPPEFFNIKTDASLLDMQSVEKQHIIKVLIYTGANKTEAARLLGIGLTTLYRKMEEYKIPRS